MLTEQKPTVRTISQKVDGTIGKFNVKGMMLNTEQILQMQSLCCRI